MLEILDVSRTYANGVAALRGVTLSIPRGLYGLLGPNGAGKSSLMRTIATLQELDGGSVRFRGEDIFADPTAHRRRLGYLPQDFGVYPGISALALLDHLAVLKGIGPANARRAQVERMLAHTNLWEHRKRAVSSFSGGMRQRFGIAQALLGDPALVVVDEPTAGLDPEERNRFHNLLAEIGEQVTVVLSTHLVDDVQQLCGRLAILSGGQVVGEGTPEALIAPLRGRVWTATVPRAAADGLLARGRPLSRRLAAGAERIRVLAEASPGPEFAATEPDLSDVYFDAVGRDPA